jgi:plastocyanin
MPFAWRINITKNPKKGKPAIYTFEETPPNVKVTDVVFWRNNDKVAHWPGLPGNATAFLPNQIAAQSTSPMFAPKTPAPINYVCSLHEGETGVIDVGDAPPNPPPPTPAPPSSAKKN